MRFDSYESPFLHLEKDSCRSSGHVINRILHEWSFNMEFLKLVR